MPADRRLFTRFALALALMLAACQPAKPPPTPPPPVVPTIMPLPPRGSAPDMIVPDKDESGHYVTPNRNMVGEQALWHVRMALNVAALGCRTPGEPAKVQYNRMLHIHVVALKKANDTVEESYKARYGVNAFDMRERLNTIVYNFFSLPPAQKAFCDVAVATLTIANGMTPEQLIDYAPKALQALEKPFEDFWDEYAEYLRKLEEWRKRFGRPSVKVEGWHDESTPPPAPAAPHLPTEQMPDTPPQKPSDMILPPG